MIDDGYTQREVIQNLKENNMYYRQNNIPKLRKRMTSDQLAIYITNKKL